MRAQGYRFAVQWIADNDSPADRVEAEVVQGYISVALVSDIYGKDQAEVARDVVAIRARAANSV